MNQAPSEAGRRSTTVEPDLCLGKGNMIVSQFVVKLGVVEQTYIQKDMDSKVISVLNVRV